MKRLLLLALCSGSYCEAFAKDSDWKICKGETTLFSEPVKILVNAYEHRNGEGRAADLTFIYGGHVLKGSLNTSEATSGAVKLKDGSSHFKGTAALDYPASTLILSGKLSLDKLVTDLNATLECETL